MQNFTPIEVLNLEKRTLNALINGGISSVEQMEDAFLKGSIRNLRGIGENSGNEIAAAVEKRRKACEGIPLTILEKAAIVSVINESPLTAQLKLKALASFIQ